MLLNLPQAIFIIFLSNYCVEPSNGLFRSYRVNNILSNINKPQLNRRKVDDIFSLLADIDEPSVNAVEFKKNQAESYFAVRSKLDQTSDETLDLENNFPKRFQESPLKLNEISSKHFFPRKIPEVHLKRKEEKFLKKNLVVKEKEKEAANYVNFINDIPHINQKTKDSSTFNKYLSILSSATDLNFYGSESIRDVIETVSKVSKIYEHEKEKLKKLNKPTKHNKYPSELYSILISAAKAFGHLLDPSSIDVILKKIKEAKEENEILEKITSVILETEGRSGYGHGQGLTLDPVTCIALVTLAAYLIRAIFQILTLTTTASKRSLSGYDVYDKFLYNSDVPFIMSNGSGYSTENLVYTSLAFNGENNENWFRDGLVKLPGEVALAFKLVVDDERPCLQEFICLHLKGRYFKNFGFSQLLWSSVALYDDFNIKKLISTMLLDEEGECSKTQISCKNKNASEKCQGCQKRDKMPPEKCLKCPTQTFNQYIQLQTLIHKLFEEFLHLNNY
ncbi:UNVERIFIED_CONTAM: hypothetical protein RMT77_008980 [Armadillidium vulgare]